jgi:hypothetical protein
MSSEYLIPILESGLDRLLHSQLDLLQVADQILTLAVILLIADLGLDRSVHLLPLQQTPVKTFEVVHVLDLAEIIHCPLLGVFLQQAGDQLLSGRVCVAFWEGEGVFLDLVVDGCRVIAVVTPVGQGIAHHFVEDDSQRPDIHFE